MIKLNKRHLIHTVLGHSYLAFLGFFCLAIFIDTLYPIKINSIYQTYGGIAFVCIGTIFIFWAQMNSKKSLHERHLELNSDQAFQHGPYKFIRTPTQAGIFLLIVGLGFTLDSLWVIIFAVIALVVNVIFFVRKQEMILEKRYGESYKIYKTKVRF
jgi:protein-S-isoprenylcysteine O-methyltransferase Ste14